MFVSPKNFALPQSRPRVYGLFFKAGNLSAASFEARSAHVEAAVACIHRCQTSGLGPWYDQMISWLVFRLGNHRPGNFAHGRGVPS